MHCENEENESLLFLIPDCSEAEFFFLNFASVILISQSFEVYTRVCIIEIKFAELNPFNLTKI